MKVLTVVFPLGRLTPVHRTILSVTLKDGRIQQSNFHDYPILQMNEMPRVEVHIVESNQGPTGMGEMGVPPIAPAVANAIFAATGKRIRHIPIRRDDLKA